MSNNSYNTRNYNNIDYVIHFQILSEYVGIIIEQ